MRFRHWKMVWLGPGDQPSTDLVLEDGTSIPPGNELHLLVYWFNNFLAMSTHVSYWLERGLGIRRRIAWMARRFAGSSGLGEWKFSGYCRQQTSTCPQSTMALSFLTDNSSYVKQIQVHDNDCLRSLVQYPPDLTNNILSGQFGTVPVHIRGRMLKGRCYSRMINCKYRAELPFYGEI